MKRADRNLRIKNNELACELIRKGENEQLSPKEIDDLKNLHTGYGGLFDNTQYFTPDEVINYMIESIKLMGFKEGKVLEPSCGNGKIIDSLIKNFNNLDITGVELSRELYKLNKICYPTCKFINDDTLDYIDEFNEQYDLVIGNPPYGKAPKNKELPLGKSTLEGQFFEFCLNTLKPGGHLILVLPTSVLSSDSYRPLRNKAIEDFILIQSISLPNSAFYKSNTSVSTSIIHLMKKELQSEKNYSVFMAIADSIGWDNSGKELKNDLIEILSHFKEFVENEKLQYKNFFNYN